MGAVPVLASPPPSKLPLRPLGRTGIKVPILGFGSGSRFLMCHYEDKAIAALATARSTCVSPATPSRRRCRPPWSGTTSIATQMALNAGLARMAEAPGRFNCAPWGRTWKTRC